MITSSFNIVSTSQKITIRSNEISASGSLEYAYLRIPLLLTLNPLNRNFNDYSKFEIPTIKAVLFSGQEQFACSETTILSGIRVYDSIVEWHPVFDFPLTAAIIEKIENSRKENIRFEVRITMSINVFINISLPQFDKLPVFSSTENANANILFELEQSFWIKNVLPKLGYRALRLIELPGYSPVIPKAYEKSLTALDHAHEYFIKGDYDKSVAHCRIAIEDIKKAFDKMKKKIESEGEKNWLKRITDSTEEWLAKITIPTYHLTSAPHHSFVKDHFSRQDAISILLVTTAIVSFSGNVGNSEPI
jgi:hypothetical protein